MAGASEHAGMEGLNWSFGFTIENLKNRVSVKRSIFFSICILDLDSSKKKK